MGKDGDDTVVHDVEDEVSKTEQIKLLERISNNGIV